MVIAVLVSKCIPRVRGDEPTIQNGRWNRGEYSPRVRGWSPVTHEL